MSSECPHCDGSGFRIDEATNTAYDCECRAAMIARRRASALSRQLPKKFRNVSLESTFGHDLRARAPDVVRVIERYISELDSNLRTGRGLWIWGDTGTGKTEAAMLISKAALDRGFSVARFTLPQLLATIRGTYNDEDAPSYLELVERLAEVDLLHLDDAGAEQTSPWVLEQLYTIINARYEDERSILITTNLEETDGLAKQIGARTASRLSEMCEILPLRGNDQRVQRGTTLLRSI